MFSLKQLLPFILNIVLCIHRKKTICYFTEACAKHGLPKESKKLFHDLPLCEYLNDKVICILFSYWGSNGCLCYCKTGYPKMKYPLHT